MGVGVGSGSGASPQAAKPRHRATVSRAARMFRKRLGLLPKGASIFCGKSLPLRGRIRAFQREPVPPRYAPAARYPSALRGNFGLAYNGNGASIFYSCLSHSVFPALRGNEIENQSFREFIFGKTLRPAPQGAKPGGIEPSRRRFRRHAGSYLGSEAPVALPMKSRRSLLRRHWMPPRRLRSSPPGSPAPRGCSGGTSTSPAGSRYSRRRQRCGRGPARRSPAAWR